MIEWITTNWDVLLGLVAALIGLATIIVKLTPSTKDDVVVDKVKGVFESATGRKV